MPLDSECKGMSGKLDGLDNAVRSDGRGAETGWDQMKALVVKTIDFCILSEKII